MDIAIVHYNTPELTGALIKSIRKWTPADTRVTVFENSSLPKRRLKPANGVEIIDNTKGQIIDFDAFLEGFPDREMNERSCFGSVKHMMSVDWLFDVLTDGFILMDSDILLKQDCSDLVDTSVAWTGQMQYGMTFGRGRFRPRLLPFICWLNVPMAREHGIRYFDENRTWKLRPGMFYDTGASYYLDCRRAGLPDRQIRWEDYAEHFKGGSWDDRDPAEWLRQNQALYITKGANR